MCRFHNREELSFNSEFEFQLCTWNLCGADKLFYLPVSVQEFPAEAWVNGGLLQGWEHWVQQWMHWTFWRKLPLSYYLHHSLVSGQTTRREHSPVHQQKIGLKIYWAWPHPSECSFPLSQSLPSGNFHKLLILLYQRADRLKTTITEN